MSGYDDLTAADLRERRDYWREKICDYARGYLEAEAAGDIGRQLGLRVALEQALSESRRITRLLKLGVAA